MEFTHYYGKHKRKNNVCPQLTVDTKDDLLKVRLPGNLKKKIMSRSQEVKKSASELTRILWQNYFDKFEAREWAEEVKNL